MEDDFFDINLACTIPNGIKRSVINLPVPREETSNIIFSSFIPSKRRNKNKQLYLGSK